MFYNTNTRKYVFLDYQETYFTFKRFKSTYLASQSISSDGRARICQKRTNCCPNEIWSIMAFFIHNCWKQWCRGESTLEFSVSQMQHWFLQCCIKIAMIDTNINISNIAVILTEMEKTYNKARAHLGAWEISTQNMCKKCSKPFKSEQKCQKLHKKRQTTLKNGWKKQTKNSTPVNKLAQTASTASAPFSISAF